MFDPNKPRVLVALGGKSSERSTSISSGKEVAKALENLGYQTAVLDTGTGRIMQTPELDSLENDPKKMPLVANIPLIDIARHFSVVFIAMHGKFGEDGVLQGLLDEINIKYVGSRAYSSAVSMDKRFAKYAMIAHEIPTPDFQIIKSKTDKLKIKFPLVVKPIAEGSSVGVSICENPADYDYAIKTVLESTGDAIVEPYIGKKEFTVCILENDKGEAQALPVVEIIPKGKFFDYKAKYDGSTQEVVPAKIGEKLTKELKDLALRVFKILDCRHFARVDFILDQKGKPFVLELNTIPGLTKESLFPKAARAAGYDFEKLIDHLIKIAIAD
ncbi:MAG: D-alanine--D-alanine ligase [Candidatus Berkelbacteria bacterium]|nr:D-alanine--D-alanine ligase [Candidatus Berkelbacteria bacterium]